MIDINDKHFVFVAQKDGVGAAAGQDCFDFDFDDGISEEDDVDTFEL